MWLGRGWIGRRTADRAFDGCREVLDLLRGLCGQWMPKEPGGADRVRSIVPGAAQGAQHEAAGLSTDEFTQRRPLMPRAAVHKDQGALLEQSDDVRVEVANEGASRRATTVRTVQSGQVEDKGCLVAHDMCQRDAVVVADDAADLNLSKQGFLRFRE